jgi:hypothetical protein
MPAGKSSGTTSSHRATDLPSTDTGDQASDLQLSDDQRREFRQLADTEMNKCVGRNSGSFAGGSTGEPDWFARFCSRQRM